MSWIIGALLGMIAAVTLTPRSVFAEATTYEQRLLRLFVLVRSLMPLVVEFVGSNAGQFFASGGWDSNRYHRNGTRVFEQLTAGLSVNAHAQVPGTGSVELATGYLYLVIGQPARMVAVYLMSMLASIGMLLFWWATRDLISERRNMYTTLVLFAPTLLFWNSTLGKEAFISFGLGCLVATLRMILLRRIGLRMLLISLSGVASVAFVRPHVLLVFCLALGLSLVLGRSNRRIGKRPGGRIILVGALSLGLAISANLSGSLLGAEDASDLLDAAYDRAEATSAGQGNSAYSADPVRSPAQLPGALAIVLLRPFPWEVRTMMQALASIESLAILALLAGQIARLSRGTHRVDLNLLVMSFGIYIVVFSAGISTYGNFGLVVRQRLQVWQFLIFLLIYTVPRTRAVVGRRLTSVGRS